MRVALITYLFVIVAGLVWLFTFTPRQPFTTCANARDVYAPELPRNDRGSFVWSGAWVYQEHPCP